MNGTEATKASVPVDPAPEELLEYLAAYKVVVCKSCKYAIQPTGMSGHLRDIHHLRHPQRVPFQKLVSKLSLDPPRVAIKTPIVQFPVPGLPVQDGLQCEAEGCKHLCASEKRMKGHWYAAHGRPGRPLIDWRPVPLQTLFRGNLLRYFTYPDSDVPPVDHYCPLIQNGARADTNNKQLNGYDSAVTTGSAPLIPNNLTEVETILFEHFITSTSLTLATDYETKVLWQTTVPRLAHEHQFLLHGLLACAGLHLAYLNPTQATEFTIAARSQQDIAMPLYRSAMNNVDVGNCDACLAFSHILVIYTWASEKEDERLLLVETEGEDMLPTWLYFIRSGCSLMCHVWDDILAGPVEVLASQWDIPITPPTVRTDLVVHLFSAVPECLSPEAWPEEEIKIYRAAAVELGTAFACTPLVDNYTTWDTLRIWPMYASADFFALLRTWHPGALILLAHFCLLLQRVEKNWYFEGRASRLLFTILQHLDAKWHCYILWPLGDIPIPIPPGMVSA